MRKTLVAGSDSSHFGIIIFRTRETLKMEIKKGESINMEAGNELPGPHFSSFNFKLNLYHTEIPRHFCTFALERSTTKKFEFVSQPPCKVRRRPLSNVSRCRLFFLLSLISIKKDAFSRMREN